MHRAADRLQDSNSSYDIILPAFIAAFGVPVAKVLALPEGWFAGVLLLSIALLTAFQAGANPGREWLRHVPLARPSRVYSR